MSSGDALTPGKTGGVGSAIFHLHDNGTLEYQVGRRPGFHLRRTKMRNSRFPLSLCVQVQVSGLTSDFLGLTIEVKPRRRNKRSVLYDLTPEFSRATGRAGGSWSRLEARHIHMLLQNELFLNVATAHHQDGELRGQIRALLYNGLEAPRHGPQRSGSSTPPAGFPAAAHIWVSVSHLSELPVPLAGQFVTPPVRTGASGHAWVSVDRLCHLHYEIVVAGLSKSDDITVNAHLHGLAEIGDMDDSSTTHRRLLTGFYGSQVCVVVVVVRDRWGCETHTHTLISSRLREC